MITADTEKTNSPHDPPILAENPILKGLKAAHDEAEAAIERQGQKGFKKMSDKEIDAKKETMKKYRRALAEAFQAAYEKIREAYEIELYATVQQMQGGPIMPSLQLRRWTKPPEASTKPWSEAMRENLNTRMDCQHVPDEIDEYCDKCKLPRDAWGKDGKGCSEAYVERQNQKIADQQKKEQEGKKEGDE